MVFSNQSEIGNIQVSSYASTSIAITPQPLIQSTTVKNYISFSVQIKLYNCTRNVLQTMLNGLGSEILGKVDKILAPFNGQVGDGNNGNFETTTIGYGAVNVDVSSTPLLQGTSDPNKIVFAVEVDILNCNRPKLADVLSTLELEIINKVDDVL